MLTWGLYRFCCRQNILKENVERNDEKSACRVRGNHYARCYGTPYNSSGAAKMARV